MKFIEIVKNDGSIVYINSNMVIGVIIDRDTKGLMYATIELTNDDVNYYKKFTRIRSVDSIDIKNINHHYDYDKQ